MRIAAALGLLLAFPATASAHENGWHTWSLYKHAHLSLEAPDVSEELDPTTARAERRYDRTVARLRSEWQEFDANYWASLEPEPVAEEPAVQEEVAPSGDIWSQLAMCESTMQNLPCDPYCGYFQFMPSTYASITGHSCVTCDSYATQKAAAQQLVARSGWGQFPGCAAQLGLL